jgi:hypothetical protein
VEFDAPKRLGGVKKLLGANSIHLEVANGDATQNKEYCSKEGDVAFELGASGGHQGARNDLSGIQDALRGGASIADISQSHFEVFVRYHRGIERAVALQATPRSWRTQVVYIYGPPGIGKSRRAHAESDALCGGRVSRVNDPTLQWFDGWTAGHKGVVIDDFAGEAKVAMLLRLLDRYPMKVPVKGGFLEWNPRIVWITSNYSLEHWYGHLGVHYTALERRIDEILHME